MAKSIEAKAREELQNRVAKGVWGLLLIVMGVLFMLADVQKTDIGESRFQASHAVDGNTGTRWSSSFSDPQWITVDLQAAAEITRVKLNWEAAYATEYEIQVSNDSSTWTTALKVADGDGGIDDHGVAASGRYVRMKGIKRATPYGYSLWELEVYGTAGPATAEASSSGNLLSQGKTAMATSTEGVSYWTYFWPLYWPLLLIAAGLPALLVPKDGADQVFGLFVTGMGVFFQLQKLEVIAWPFAQVWPILLIMAGVLLVGQAWRHVNGSGSKAGPQAPPAGTGE